MIIFIWFIPLHSLSFPHALIHLPNRLCMFPHSSTLLAKVPFHFSTWPLRALTIVAILYRLHHFDSLAFLRDFYVTHAFPRFDLYLSECWLTILGERTLSRFIQQLIELTAAVQETGLIEDRLIRFVIGFMVKHHWGFVDYLAHG